MMRLRTLILTLLICGSALHSPAFSADALNPLQPDETAKPETPPQGLPPMPKPAAPTPAQTPQEVAIPALPPSLTCKPEWLYGLWELQHVYESPLGKETQAYNANPVQYISFAQKDSRFYRYNAGRTEIKPEDVVKLMNEHSSAVLQFLLQDAGMLYIYQDSVAADTQVCFIVAETLPPFAAGNLLIMPPKEQIKGRLIKVYKKVWPPKAQPQNPAPQQQQPQRHTVRHFGR